MSSLDDRRRGPRRPMRGPDNLSFVLALGVAGLLLGAVLSYWMGSEAVLKDWANPV